MEPLTQVFIACPVDGGNLEHDPGMLREKTLVCVKCGAKYPFTPDLSQGFDLREMIRRGA